MQTILSQLPAVWVDGWHPLARVALELLLSGVIGFSVYFVASKVVARVVGRTRFRIDNLLYDYLCRPSKFVVPAFFMLIARSRARLAAVDADGTIQVTGGVALIDHLVLILFIAAITWLLLSLVGALAAYLKEKHDITAPDNREARRVHTQITVVGHTVRTLVIMGGIAAVLMTFPRVQQVGTSLLASAGIAGIAIGLAARPVLENIIAGIQIGITQPIRLDDVVIVEGEWGRVEEITLTYVVVRIWDERRLIVPFNKFITEAFQNWTRTSAQILGTVFLYVDYRTEVEKIRKRAREIVEASDKWDKRVFVVQVTDLTERTMQVRILVSASSSGQAFDLRVEIREKLLSWMQSQMPEALPRIRMDISPDESDTDIDHPGMGKNPMPA